MTVAPSASHACPTSSTDAARELNERLDRQPLGLDRPLLEQLAAHRVGRVLVDLDRAAGAERPAAGPRGEPRARAARPASGRRRRGPRTGPTGSGPRRRESGAAPSATGWSSSDSRSGVGFEARRDARPAVVAGRAALRRAVERDVGGVGRLAGARTAPAPADDSPASGSQGPRASTPVDRHGYTVPRGRLARLVQRRRKHWGWGFEDEQPSAEELRGAAAFLSSASGSARPSPSSRSLWRRCRCRPPRAGRARSARRRSARPTTTSARCTATAARTPTSCAPSAGASITRPTWSPTRATSTSCERVLDWALSAGAAVIPFGGGTSVVGGVEASTGCEDRCGRRDDRPQGARPRARGRPGVAVGADPGRRHRDRGSSSSSASTG